MNSLTSGASGNVRISLEDDGGVSEVNNGERVSEVNNGEVNNGERERQAYK